MKSNLSQNLALKLVPNDNYFTEKLVDISWIEFQLFISNWKRFDPYFPLLKQKNWAQFFWNESFWMKSQSKGLEVSIKWQLLHWGIEFKLFISNWKRFDLYFPLLKPKNQARFLLPFRQSKWKHESMKANLSQKAMKLAPNDNYMSIFVSFTSYIYINTIFKVINNFQKIFLL